MCGALLMNEVKAVLADAMVVTTVVVPISIAQSAVRFRHAAADLEHEIKGVASPAGVGAGLTTIPIVGRQELESEPRCA
jgi:hypothetical protein